MTTPYTLPDLSYDPSALEPHLDARIIELHHGKHHAAYVKQANDTLDKLATAREKDDFTDIVGLQKTLAFAIGGHMLHSIYWTNLSPDGGGEPTGVLATAIDENFGSFTAFKAQMTSVSSTIQGSGWGILSWEPIGQRLLIEQLYDHQDGIVLGATPLLAIDAWEHAFYLQYKNVKADYVEAIWNIVNWNDVSRRLTAAQATTIASN